MFVTREGDANLVFLSIPEEPSGVHLEDQHDGGDVVVAAARRPNVHGMNNTSVQCHLTASGRARQGLQQAGLLGVWAVQGCTGCGRALQDR